MLRAALREDAVAESLGGLLVEDTVLLEHAERVGVEHFRPFVAVVSGGISPSHNMAELHRHAGVGKLFGHHRLRPCLLLKLHDVLLKRVFKSVISHVEKPEAHLPHAAVGGIVVAALHYAVDEFIWQWLARLIMEGEGAQEFLFHGVVFHKLRGQLHEVPSHVGSAQALKAGIGEHAVQRVSEFVQECLNLAQGEQCRFLVGGFCEVHHHAHVRTYVHSLAVDELSLVFGHPGSALLALAGMEVGIEYRQIRTVAVEHLVCLHVGVIHLDVLVFAECDAVEPCCQAEYAFNHLVQFEVRPEHLGVDIVFLQFELVAKESEVPRLNFEVLSLGLAGIFLDGLDLLDGCGLVSVD